MDYCQMFPAAYSPTQKRFRVCEMRSLSYGPEHGDPLPTTLIVEDVNRHEKVHELLTKNPAVTYILGGPEHGIFNNPPTALALIFLFAAEKEAFETALGSD